MSNSFKILAGILLIAIAMLIYLESGEKEEVNWFPSYTQDDKIPFGTFVLYELMKSSREGTNIKDVRQPPFTFLGDSSDVKGTYFFVNDYIGFDESESKRVLDWVAKGNTLFIASRQIPNTIADTLNLETEFYYDLSNLERKPLVQVVNPSFKKQQPYYIDIEIPATHLVAVDTLETIALGEFDFTKDNDTLTLKQPKVHFVKQQFGEGEIILHLMPEVFTNYFMLREDHYAYTEKVLSYLPQDTQLIWDHHYKNGRARSTSPLYVLFQNRYLKYAYYILIVGVLLWVLFEGRRKQRAIPVVTPLPNQTLAFTKTIAGMYLDKRDHTSIAHHQITHFMEYVRSHYGLPTQTINEEFVTKLASKSSNTLEDTRTMINFIVFLRDNNYVTQDQVTALTKKIEDFKE